MMVNGPAAVYVERAGRLAALDAPALTAQAVARAAIQIARPLGEDPATDPIIDARLADGSRGPCAARPRPQRPRSRSAASEAGRSPLRS